MLLHKEKLIGDRAVTPSEMITAMDHTRRRLYELSADWLDRHVAGKSTDHIEEAINEARAEFEKLEEMLREASRA